MKKALMISAVLVGLPSCNQSEPGQGKATAIEPVVRYVEQSAPADLLPYIQERLFEMRDDYQTSVQLVNALRGQADFDEQYQLLQAHVDELLLDIEELEALETIAVERTLNDTERDQYRTLVRSWEARSAAMRNVLQRTNK